MAARLFAKTGPFRDCEHRFDAEASVGRSSSNDLTLDSGYVSSRHARIYFDDQVGCYVVEDRNSRNGVLVDGMRVRRQQKLGALHVVSFSRAIEFIFQVLDEGAAPSTPTEDATQVGDAGVVIPSIVADPEARGKP